MKTIKVMIVDDSASVRMILRQVLEQDPEIEVIAAAHDPFIADNYLKKAWPDVIILDVEMPKKDGITYLREIMQRRPTPVVICSSFTQKNATITIEAMRAGAVEILTKPKIGVQDYLSEASMMIIDAVKSASEVNLSTLKKNVKSASIQPREIKTKDTGPLRKVEPRHTADVILSSAPGKAVTSDTEKIIAIGASAGGTQAIEVILKGLPVDVPGIVIVQHMPENFTEAFAQRLDHICSLHVKEASDGDRIERGTAIVAPGNRHCLIKRSGPGYAVEIKDGPPVSRHRPAVDVLFRSVAKFAGKNALGIILTGMGDDGAAGMVEMHKSGVKTIAQDENTSIVFGMPREAINRGAVDLVMPLGEISGEMLRYGKCNGTAEF